MKLIVVLAFASASLLRGGHEDVVNGTTQTNATATMLADAQAGHVCLSEIDFILILDASGAVDKRALDYQKLFAVNIATPMLSGNARMAVIVYSRTPQTVTTLGTTDLMTTKLAIANLKRPVGYERNAAQALAMAQQLLMTGGRMSAQSTIMMVMAGGPADIGGMDLLSSNVKQSARLMIVTAGYSTVNAMRAKEWASRPTDAFDYKEMGELVLAGCGKFVPELCPQISGVR